MTEGEVIVRNIMMYYKEIHGGREKMMCEICGNEFFGRKPVENKEGKKGVYCPYCKSFNEFQRKTKKKKQGGKR